MKYGNPLNWFAAGFCSAMAFVMFSPIPQSEGNPWIAVGLVVMNFVFIAGRILIERSKP